MAKTNIQPTGTADSASAVVIEPAIDFSKYSAGCVDGATFAGEPVDALKHILFSRAGIPLAHDLQSNLVNTRPGDPSRCARLPDPFDPEKSDTPLISVQDWLDYIDKVQVLPTPIVHEPVVISNPVLPNP